MEIDNNVLTAKGGRIEIKIEESSYAKIIFCIDNDFMWQIYDGYYSKDGTFVFDIMKVGVE